MQAHAKVAVTVVLLGVIGIGGYRWAQPWIAAKLQKGASDSAHIEGTLRIGMDGWVGYFPLCSPEMVKRLRAAGWLLECRDDNADYPERFARLRDGGLDFGVATADSYLLNGGKSQFPGPIVAVIDESKGGDALVARQADIATLDSFKAVADFKVAYTPASPSHHLLKAIASHFDVPQLREPAHALPADGSEAALAALRDNKAQAAVLWEPQVSEALKLPGVVKLMSTADTQGLIVDVLIAGQDLARKNPARIELLLDTYFQTLQHYRTHQAQLVEDIARHYKIDGGQARTLMAGVDWASLSDNAYQWFGLETSRGLHQGLVETLEASVHVLMEAGDFTASPIPNRDPYRLISSAALAEVWRTATFALRGEDGGGGLTFNALDAEAWQRLQTLATFKVRPVVFASGSAELTQAGREQLDQLARDLKHYPRFRVEVRGHTGTRGDAQANMALSQARAEAVYDYLHSTHRLATHRARAIGFGGERPLARQPGESLRAYNYRLPRVELVLLEEEI